jgi:hypothetical protein
MQMMMSLQININKSQEKINEIFLILQRKINKFVKLKLK